MKAKARTAAASVPPAAKRTRTGATEQRPAAQPQVAQPADRPERSYTTFELRMHEVCRQIPAGRVSTYGALAEVLHSAPRAVGQALRRVQYDPEAVPCHRVISADLRLGGYSGLKGEHTPAVQRKKALLQEEGVDFDGAYLADPMLVMLPEDF